MNHHRQPRIKVVARLGHSLGEKMFALNVGCLLYKIIEFISLNTNLLVLESENLLELTLTTIF